MDDELRTFIERDRVQQTLNAYHQAVSRFDLEAMFDTYAPDGTWELKLGGEPLRYTGTDELRRGYQEMFVAEGDKFDPPQGPEVQINAPATITFQDDKAYAHSVLMILLRPYAGKMEAITGFYDDVLRKIDGAWKFERRTFTLNFFARAPEPEPLPADQ